MEGTRTLHVCLMCLIMCIAASWRRDDATSSCSSGAIDTRHTHTPTHTSCDPAKHWSNIQSIDPQDIRSRVHWCARASDTRGTRSLRASLSQYKLPITHSKHPACWHNWCTRSPFP
uniref:Putative secreted protein n=1 Tax=Anopheles darlingi TaxID=43151 RepID=A0A2M4D1Y8_ANODA